MTTVPAALRAVRVGAGDRRRAEQNKFAARPLR
jgi:hypothetical protein